MSEVYDQTSLIFKQKKNLVQILSLAFSVYLDIKTYRKCNNIFYPNNFSGQSCPSFSKIPKFL